MNKDKIAEEIIEEISKAEGGPIKYCIHCSYPNICLFESTYSCPERNRWLKKLKSEIEKILENYHSKP